LDFQGYQMGIYDFSIYDLICRGAANFGDRECLVFHNSRLNYRHYKIECDQLAAGLFKLGVKAGDRIAVIAQNSLDFMIIYGSAAKLGAIVVAINCRYQSGEVAYILNDSQPKIVFSGVNYIEMVEQTAGNIQSVQGVYAIGLKSEQAERPHLQSLYEEAGEYKAGDVSVDSGFVIIPTAAVSGKPLCALLSHKNLIASNVITMLQFGLTENDTHLGILPLSHVAGLSLSFAVMHSGGKNVLMDHFDSEHAVEIIKTEKATIFYQFPPMLEKIAEKCKSRPADISSLRIIGGIDTPASIEKFLDIAPNVRFWSGYAQTEAMGVSYGLMAEKPGSVGKPSHLVRVKICDESDREVEAGNEGEICVRSPAVFLGYWGRAYETAYTFRNEWHHTGDVGCLDEEGYLWYVGRKAQKQLIKTGGENVYPSEVEKVILEHKGIKEVCVIGVQDARWGEAIKAVCVGQSGLRINESDLMEFVASRIARYKKPKIVVFTDALPRDAKGDIDRDLVKAEYGKVE
jgi:acyl-CoA synthetase (AMP-forming)/AMP-acid ligase II